MMDQHLLEPIKPNQTSVDECRGRASVRTFLYLRQMPWRSDGMPIISAPWPSFLVQHLNIDHSSGQPCGDRVEDTQPLTYPAIDQVYSCSLSSCPRALPASWVSTLQLSPESIPIVRVGLEDGLEERCLTRLLDGSSSGQGFSSCIADPPNFAPPRDRRC